MRILDFTSWQGLLSTLLGLALITLIGVGVRLLVMQTIQHRRERENRQINERLRTLIAAYKVLGGSFTGDLSVSPAHLRDLLRRDAEHGAAEADAPAQDGGLPAPSASDEAAEPAGERRPGEDPSRFERPRRVRDAVEAALSDIILLGTEEQVRLAAQAASELAAGRPIHTAELVVSLRDFIRSVLGLEAVPATVAIPRQGPLRPSAGARGRGEAGGAAGRGAAGGSRGAGGGAGAGMGVGMAAGLGAGTAADDGRDRSR